MRTFRISPSAYSASGLCTAAMAVLLLTSCAKSAEDTAAEGSSPDEASTYDGPPLTFEEALTEVLVPSCGFDSCHGSGAGYLRIHDRQTEEEWLELNSTVLITRPMIVPGDSSTSYLIKKMEGSSDVEGDVMPPSGSISGYRIGMVRSWIDNLEVD